MPISVPAISCPRFSGTNSTCRSSRENTTSQLEHSNVQRRTHESSLNLELNRLPYSISNAVLNGLAIGSSLATLASNEHVPVDRSPNCVAAQCLGEDCRVQPDDRRRCIHAAIPSQDFLTTHIHFDDQSAASHLRGWRIRSLVCCAHGVFAHPRTSLPRLAADRGSPRRHLLVSDAR